MPPACRTQSCGWASLSPVDQLGSTFKDYAVSHHLAGALDHQITIRNPWDPSAAQYMLACLQLVSLSLCPSRFNQHHPLFGLPFLTTDYCGLQPGPPPCWGPTLHLCGVTGLSPLLLPGPCPCSMTSINVTPSRYVCVCVCACLHTRAHTHTQSAFNSLAKELVRTLSNKEVSSPQASLGEAPSSGYSPQLHHPAQGP